MPATEFDKLRNGASVESPSPSRAGGWGIRTARNAIVTDSVHEAKAMVTLLATIWIVFVGAESWIFPWI